MNILVFCTGNAARSILPECLLGQCGGDHITSFSASSQPSGGIHPEVVAVLAHDGFDVRDQRSKKLGRILG